MTNQTIRIICPACLGKKHSTHPSRDGQTIMVLVCDTCLGIGTVPQTQIPAQEPKEEKTE